MSKHEYRDYFLGLKSKIKFSYFLQECSIDKARFSRFMLKNADWEISIDKLSQLKECITNTLDSLM